MTVILPHNTTEQDAIAIIDRSLTEIFATAGSVELTERMRRWEGSLLNFALTANVGFLSLPIDGRVLIDETLITVDCELPQIARTFIGEATIRTSVEEKIREILRRDQVRPA